MTMEEIRNSGKEMLTPKDISEVMRIHSTRITEYGRQGMLPFPCFRTGKQIKIPRGAFLNWMDGKPMRTEE